MAANTRTKFERERDLEMITSYYLRGKYQSEIATIIGVSLPQIKYDLRTIQKRWRESSMVNMNEAKQRELTRIDELERAAWDAWERSKETFVSTRSETSGDGKRDKEGRPIASKGKLTKVTEERYGDPRFLDIVTKCVEKRSKILGLDEPDKHEDVTRPKQSYKIGDQEIEF